jgi:hypothetical protein
MHQRRKIRPFYVFIVAVVIAMLAMFGVYLFCGYISLLGFAEAFSGCSPSNVKELENAGQFQLPPSARNLSSGCFGMQGWDGHAEFEMSSSDLSSFVASTKIKLPLVPNEIPKDSSLMTPASHAKSYLHGRYDSYVPKSDTTYYQEILVDTTDPAKYLVFVKFGGG